MNTKSVTGNIFNALSKEFDDINDFFFGKDFSLPNLFASGYNKMNGWRSKFPFYNTKIVAKNEFVIELALAGYKKDDIEIHDNEGILTISTLTQEAQSEATECKAVPPSISSLLDQGYPIYLHKGLSQKSFSVSFKLPERYEISAPKFEDGILSIKIRAFEKKSQPSRKIDIE